MFLPEDDLPEGTPLSFFEKLNWIFRLIGIDNAGDWAGRPSHGGFSCQHSAEHIRAPCCAGIGKRFTWLSYRAWRRMGHPVNNGETTDRIPLQTEAQDDAESAVGASGGSERTHCQNEGCHEQQGPLSLAYHGLQQWLHGGTAFADRRSKRHGDAEPKAVGGERSARCRINYVVGAQRDGGGSETRTDGQRLRSAARGGIAADGPLGLDRQSGAILGLIAVLILACCNEKPRNDNEASTPSGITSTSSTSREINFVITVSHCAEKNLEGEVISVSIWRKISGKSQTAPEQRFRSVVNDGQVKLSLFRSNNVDRFGVQARHEKYGYSSFSWVPLGGNMISLCFNKMNTKNFKGSEYTFKKWRDLMNPDQKKKFDELDRVISDNFENLLLRSKHWNDWNPRKISELDLRDSAPEKNVYNHDYKTCSEYRNEEKKTTCETLVNAKAGLLNLYATLQVTSPADGEPESWWTYIEEIKMIQPDRIVAIVNEEMVVRIIGEKERDSPDDLTMGFADVCGCKESKNNAYEYKDAWAILHKDNFRAAIDGNPTDIKIDSIKTKHSHAPLQLTITKEPVNGKYFLDADIDEHSGFKHVRDGFRHRFLWDSTNPFRIRNMLPTAYPEIKEFGYHQVEN